ncbi:MAG: glycoside hydrolase family 97 protein [Paludibacteraceae bacterium]|nr:glycoside hydrolase family 97 protein [Paludibacteraceae bacterium]
MKRLFSFLLFVAVTATSFAISVGSPNQRIKLIFDITLKDSVPYYQVFFDGKEVVAKSEMGFLLDGDKDLKHGFSLNSVDVKDFSSTWMPILGQYAEIEDKYNNCVVSLVQNSTGRTMRIVFRLYNEGLAFRYEFDKQDNLGYFRIADEVTQFAMTDDHTAWWIPGAYDSNEFFYTKSKLSDIDATKVDGSGIGTNQVFDKNAVQSPIMMKTSKKLYLNIFEAALVDYPAMHLLYNRKKKTFNAALAPTPVEGVKAFMQTPCNTPWRTIFVTDDAREILASSMILNLNEPCKIENTTWIKPVKYVGIWWQMHAPGQGTWNYADVPNIKLAETDWSKLTPNGRHAATTENTMRYIDFAAEHGFDAVLVEGWNVGWEDWAGQWKEEVFDFVTPYPDFDVKKVTAYARAKGVELIMHHETSGSATNYERRIDEAFDFMKEYGYNSVKTGYVGRIIPRGEYHDGQWMVNHYNRVLEKAADRRIMVNAHEPVRPTGLSRTYPNLLACEAARGNEFNAWSVGNPPSHEIDLAFTRLLGGAMDYTPGIFEIKMDYYQPGNPCQIHTTLAKQLALYVTMYSPLQMAADLPENYERYMDAFQFIKDVDVDWLDTKVLEAEPGEYITIARKGKKYGQWFVGAITAAKARKAVIDFSFLQPDVKYIATVYADAKNADWQKNPKAYTITNYIVTNETKAKIQLAASGGCAISLKVATTEDLEKKYKKL